MHQGFLLVLDLIWLKSTSAMHFLLTVSISSACSAWDEAPESSQTTVDSVGKRLQWSAEYFQSQPKLLLNVLKTWKELQCSHYAGVAQNLATGNQDFEGFSVSKVTLFWKGLLWHVVMDEEIKLLQAGRRGGEIKNGTKHVEESY